LELLKLIDVLLFYVSEASSMWHGSDAHYICPATAREAYDNVIFDVLVIFMVASEVHHIPQIYCRSTLGPRGKNVHSTKRDSCQVSG
jgi:hypothetical protein